MLFLLDGTVSQSSEFVYGGYRTSTRVAGNHKIFISFVGFAESIVNEKFVIIFIECIFQLGFCRSQDTFVRNLIHRLENLENNSSTRNINAPNNFPIYKQFTAVADVQINKSAIIQSIADLVKVQLD